MDTRAKGPVVVGAYLGHDQGVCLLRGGRVEVAIEEERLNRYKHGRPRALGGLWRRFSGKFGYFPWTSLSYCLQAAGLEISDVDLFIFGDDQWAADAKETLGDFFPVRDKRKILYVDQPANRVHHFHHALVSFFASGFAQAAVLVVDGDGNVSEEGYEAETGLLMKQEGEWSEVFKNRYTDKAPPRSGIGWMYEQVSYLLGYGNYEVGLADPGKTMGLASYGEPTPEFAQPWIEKSGFKLDFSGFREWMSNHHYEKSIFTRREGLAAGAEMPGAYARNLAFKVQLEAEEAIVHLARTLQRETGARNLCLGGGVALNSVANGKLVRERVFEKLHIVPSVHDGGQSIGLAFHGHLLLTHPGFRSGMQLSEGVAAGRFEKTTPTLSSPYLGRSYGTDEIRAALDSCGLEYELLGEDALFEQASSQLAAGRILGWFQGGSEIGPRALGNRSILAHAQTPRIQHIVNSKVKFREGFRPFAPSVLQERCTDVFELQTDSPYMLRVAKVRSEWLERVPGIVHVDQTARIQTVTASQNPRYYRLIAELQAKTGIPLVLNTSFNLKGMPIVESPLDAIICFVQTQLDELYLGSFHLKRVAPDALVYALKPGWRVQASAFGDESELEFRAPNGVATRVKTTSAVRRALPLLQGEAPLQTVLRKIGSADEELDQIDADLKRLVRLGALSLRLGRRWVSNDRNEQTWDTTLYASDGR